MTTDEKVSEYTYADDNSFYFAYSASLRVFGQNLDFESISAGLRLQPTNTHRKGDVGRTSKPYDADLWSYTFPLDESKPLQEHIDGLWTRLKPHKEYILDLKRQSKIDVFLGCRSSCEWAGVEVPHTSLEMFIELGVPFGLSIVVA